VKLCRFELKSAPGEIRSGIVYSGKVYETDGSEPVAIYEADQIRPLSPVGLPPSIRIFRAIPGLIEPDETPAYFYGSSTALTGASPIIPKPEFVTELDYEPYVVAVIAAEGANVPEEEADDLILGYTLMNILVSRDFERYEKRVGAGPGRSYDIGIPIGPVLTTPDEMEDSVETAEHGRRFKLAAVTRVNGVEKRRGDLVDLPFTFAQAISAASETAHLRTGDIIALGPIAFGEGQEYLTHDDEVQLAVERLGTLAFRIG
jgi:2-keto-4-pentenoate hydratase/2-oxohepta-3-ene-1,7-dioic acid hydratase in catechol pathway